MMRGLSVIAHFVVLLVLAMPAPSSAFPFDAIYVLGDSLSDQGNLFGATSQPSVPGPDLPASDHYFNGRFSNGPVYTDLLAQRLGLPLGPSLTGGNNFAYGGARTTYNTVEAGPPANGFLQPGLFPWTLNAEVAEFNLRVVNDPPPPNALYIVFSGANDIADILALGLPAGTVIPTAVGGILGAVQAFANAGATTVLVANIPDLGFTPAFRSLGPPGTPLNPASVVSGLFNQALQGALTALDATLDLNIIQFQTDDIFNSLVANPGQFGLSTDPNILLTPCYNGFVAPNPAGIECSDPDIRLFWDRVHPTAAVHAILADAIFGAVIPEPSTLPLLLTGMLALGVVFRSSSFKIRPS